MCRSGQVPTAGYAPPMTGGNHKQLTTALVFCAQCGKTETFIADPAATIEYLGSYVQMLDAAR